MKDSIDNRRINKTLPLISPKELKEKLPIKNQHSERVSIARKTIADIIDSKDDRLLVIVGPCSVHDPKACIEYAEKLKSIIDDYPQLYFVMRVYFEKPRTIVGWKGLINDPTLDGQYKINEGLILARQLLLSISDLGLPIATEFLDTTFGQYYSDLISVAAIGARTVESQIHRELASGLSMPIGFKNRTDGDVSVAIDAVRSASHPHSFPSINENGDTVIFTTTGNDDAFIILRGGNKSGTNYHENNILSLTEQLQDLNINKKIVVDCSHGNSGKDPDKQMLVIKEIIKQREKGIKSVGGIMLESFLESGRQDITSENTMNYGQSITDACLSFEQTVKLLDSLK